MNKSEILQVYYMFSFIFILFLIRTHKVLVVFMVSGSNKLEVCWCVYTRDISVRPHDPLPNLLSVATITLNPLYCNTFLCTFTALNSAVFLWLNIKWCAMYGVGVIVRSYVQHILQDFISSVCGGYFIYFLMFHSLFKKNK